MEKISDEQRKRAAEEVLSGISAAVVARKYSVTPGTVNQWIRDYREQHAEQDYPYPKEQAEELKRLLEVEKRYEKAVKLLGEKDLEIEILRDLLKKPIPAYPKDSR